jgi:hypothetical protein
MDNVVLLVNRLPTLKTMIVSVEPWGMTFDLVHGASLRLTLVRLAQGQPYWAIHFELEDALEAWAEGPRSHAVASILVPGTEWKEVWCGGPPPPSPGTAP